MALANVDLPVPADIVFFVSSEIVTKFQKEILLL